MTIHEKVAGEWVQRDQVYVRRNNVWTRTTEGWVKRSGVWEQCYVFDITPPPIPILTLDLTAPNTLGGRWLRVGINLPGANNTGCKLVRVLTTFNGGYPTTQYGGTLVTARDTDWPNEPWSEWYYNGYQNPTYKQAHYPAGTGWHPDTTLVSYKQYPVNASDRDKVASDKYHYFTAWSMDFNGNWSAPSQARIFVPKTGLGGTNTIVKNARLQATYSGTVTTGVGFTMGQPTQNGSPIQRGFFFYGTQLSTVGSAGPATIKDAQIRINRTNDTGQPVANVYLFRHGYESPSDLPGDGTANVFEPTLLGTINKGEAKWFSIPTTFRDNIVNRSFKGFGLWYQSPPSGPPAAADFSEMASVTDDLRSGEVYLSWTEST